MIRDELETSSAPARRSPTEKIDGAIGEGSLFHETHGYYAQGVGPETTILPGDWQSRVHRVQNANTNDRIGYCLDVADLFLSKAAAAPQRQPVLRKLTCLQPLPAPPQHAGRGPCGFQRRAGQPCSRQLATFHPYSHSTAS